MMDDTEYIPTCPTCGDSQEIECDNCDGAGTELDENEDLKVCDNCDGYGVVPCKCAEND